MGSCHALWFDAEWSVHIRADVMSLRLRLWIAAAFAAVFFLIPSPLSMIQTTIITICYFVIIILLIIMYQLIRISITILN